MFVGLKAAAGVIDAINAAISLPFDEGLECERAISRALVASPESAAQRHLFFAQRAAAKLPGQEKEKAGEGSVEIVETAGDITAYRAAIAIAKGDVIVATRFVDRLDWLSDTLERPEMLVGMTESDRVIEIVVGKRTAASAALAAMALAKKRGKAAIFVAPAVGGVITRLENKLAMTIVGLVDSGIKPGDIAATGRVFGFVDALLPRASGGTASDALERRMILPVLAEALTILDEGVAKRASDIDFAAVRGGLWPVWKGGPAFMAEQVGRDNLFPATRGPAKG